MQDFVHSPTRMFYERFGINTKIQGLEGMGRHRKSMQDFVHQQYRNQLVAFRKR